MKSHTLLHVYMFVISLKYIYRIPNNKEILQLLILIVFHTTTVQIALVVYKIPLNQLIGVLGNFLFIVSFH